MSCLRIGLGYDVHAFSEAYDGAEAVGARAAGATAAGGAAGAEAVGNTEAVNRELVLGGVRIPFERGLEGHSDADVLIHAIMDALLGAARLGDIGAHFPDSDEATRGISSLTLLEYVGGMLRAEGWQVTDIDSVVVAQAPRISPYREAMRANIARALDIEVKQVGVKATTTEYLGFEGRGEGIGAQAVALLQRAERE